MTRVETLAAHIARPGGFKYKEMMAKTPREPPTKKRKHQDIVGPLGVPNFLR
jgi:hypothetical protein